MEPLQQLVKQQGRLERKVRQIQRGSEPSAWIAFPTTWTYASATTFTIADPGEGYGADDFSSHIQAGDFIRLKQGGAYLYFIISAVAYADPTTTVTIDKQITGGQVALANAAITDNYYSKAWSPQGCGPTRFTPGYYTSTSWDGDAKNGADGIIDLSAVFGVPAGVKAVAVNARLRDETAGNENRLARSSDNIYEGIAGIISVANASMWYAGMVPVTTMVTYISARAEKQTK